ncbi:MAG: flagellar FlbD family protein [Acidimicrobiales bacterium]
MVRLTRLSGDEVVINADMIERVEPTPDSLVTLVNGARFVVQESVTEVVEAVRRYRSEIVRGVFYPSPGEVDAHPHLHIYEGMSPEE